MLAYLVCFGVRFSLYLASWLSDFDNFFLCVCFFGPLIFSPENGGGARHPWPPLDPRLSYTYHKTSACQYVWRVHTYAIDALLAKLDDGKYELFLFISKELQRVTADLHYELLTTDLVLSNKPTDVTALSPCQQEEADTRMMHHLYHAAGQGHSKAFLRIVDSDVVVLAINIFHQLRLSALWI